MKATGITLTLLILCALAYAGKVEETWDQNEIDIQAAMVELQNINNTVALGTLEGAAEPYRWMEANYALRCAPGWPCGYIITAVGTNDSALLSMNRER